MNSQNLGEVYWKYYDSHWKTEMLQFENIHYNAQMGVKQIRQYCKLEAASLDLLKNAMERLNLLARVYDRILKVSRTIADLEASEQLQENTFPKPSNIEVSIEMVGWVNILSYVSTNDKG